MNALLSFLQSAFWGWCIAVIAILIAVTEHRRTEKQIKEIEENNKNWIVN